MVDVGAAPIDRYVVLEHLSEGGMGAIYVGKKLGAGGFEMQVVLKQLLPEFTQQEEFIDLFLREAKLSATLDHANIVHTIDLVTAGNEYFIVMEYLPGGDLRTLLRKAKRRGKRFSPSASIHICREVLSALAYAHVKRDLAGTPLKLIHRDVSPSNILVSYAGEVKLTDFGIAKAATHNSLFYKVKGKIGYMSPEQAKSEPLDHRSDLYSLAVCMYEALTGERLFVHAGLTTSADEIYSQPVPQVSRKIPGLTPDLDAIMGKALALSPEDRYQTAGEFQEALTRCAHRNGLLMSAPEVALELLDCCGEPEQWRDDGADDDDLPYVQRAGTEVLESGAEEDDHDDEPAAPAHAARETLSGPVHGMPRRPVGAPPMPRASSARISRPPKTEQHKLQGVVELTSIINMIDLENQHREAMAAKAAAQAPMQLPPDEIVPRGSGGQRQPMRPQGLTGQPPARGPAIDGRGQAPTGSAAEARRGSIDESRTVRGQPPVARAPADPRNAAADPRNAPGDPRNAPGDPRNAPGDPRNRAPDPRNAPGDLRGASGDPRNASAAPRDALATVPRPRSPRLAPLAVPQLPAPARYPPQIRRRSFLRPWMVIVAILLAAAVAGVVIAMSGPDVAAQHGK